MRKLIVFNHISLDGYFVDQAGSMMWAKPGNSDPEWTEFVTQNVSGDGTLLFGRVTYDLMSSYWPTPMAAQNDRVVAERMNSLPKVVFSRTMDKASWNNTILIKDDLPGAVRKMKSESSGGLVILGSGQVVSQLAHERLVDEYHLVLNPVILGGGRTMFDGLNGNQRMKLTKARPFQNGYVFACYEPAA